MDKIEQIIAKKAVQRKENWARVQGEAPDVADFISLISKTLGKPASLSVKFGDEEVVKFK